MRLPSYFSWIFVAAAAVAEDSSGGIAQHFTDSAIKEFLLITQLLAGERASSVFQTCPPFVPAKSRCISPFTPIMRAQISNVLEATDCLPPPRGILDLVRIVTEKFADRDKYRIVGRRALQCGRPCSRRLGCCDKRDDFHLQGVRSEPCARTACAVQPLSVAEMRTLGVSGKCALAEAGFPDWQAVKYLSRSINADLHIAFKRVVCNLYGTSTPRINCQPAPVDGKCICCCHNFVPRDGLCVPETNYSENECQ